MRTTLAVLLLGLCMAPAASLASQNVVVVIDDSGSMQDKMRTGVRRIDAAKNALKIVIQKLPEDARVGVLALNQGWIIPLQQLDRNQAVGRINRLRATGGTLLGQNMKIATDALLAARDEQTYGDYRLLVLTDGEANDQETLDFVLPDILARGVVVDAIGVDMSSDHSLATKVHNYRRADDTASLQTAIAESLAESSDDQDTIGGESDFELIADLPAEVALTVLTSLSTAKNGPVGENFYPTEIEGDLGFDLSGSSVFSQAAASSQPNNYGGGNGGGGGGGRGGGGGFGFGAIFCMGIVFFAIATVSSMLKAAKRR